MKDSDNHEEPLSLSFENDEKLSRYVLEKEIGRGGFGTVYLATDCILERSIAIKVLKPEVSKVAEAAGAAFDEARVLATVEHPHIVPVYDAGKTESGEIFIVSKYIEGTTLEEALVKGGISRRAFLEKVIEISNGLETVHQLNLSHQDVKPDNILINNAQKAILIDFGIARFLGASKWFHSAGTPEYMSPEQVLGQDHLVNSQADIYSLGAILFRGLTGFAINPKWIEDNSRQAFEHIISDHLRDSSLEIPPVLVNITLKALAFHNTKRYANVRIFREDLARHLSENKSAKQITPPSQLVHRGLRSFNANDSEAFLELLPGSREPKSGLPIDVDQWKRRIEDADSSNESPLRVGIIYGPSGSGKSSLLRAGIVPQLRDGITTLQLNATIDSTESLIKQKLCHRYSHLDPEDQLPWMLRKLRLGGLPVGSKLLIVIDQFEQWLQATSDQRSSRSLIKALRQCDGVRIQAILVIREEFWRSTSQLMQELDIPMRQGENISLCTPFDKNHTRFVIEKIANTFAKFRGLSKRKQKTIIQHGLTLIEDQGRFPPVNIAILVQILEQSAWEFEVISRIKSLEDLGIFYLDTIFNSTSLQTRRDAAEAFLLTLVPDRGLIRKEAISEAELLRATNLGNDTVAFEEVVHALDQELRLISPAPKDGERAYQLSHDYLVGALRNWALNTKNKGLRGFAHSRLHTQAANWKSGDRKKLAPSIFEWALLKTLTTGKRRTIDEELYLNTATRKFLPRVILVSLVILAGAGWGVISRQKANSAVDRLLEARPQEIESAIEAAESGLFWNKERLERISQFDRTPGNRWRATLPLLDENPELKSNLILPILSGRVSEVALISKRLHPLSQELQDDLLDEVVNETSAATGLRATCALIGADLPADFWKEQATRISAWYIEESWDPQWITLLAPLAPHLEDAMFQQLKNGDESAAQFLSSVYAGDFEQLKKYVFAARAAQLPTFLKNYTTVEDLSYLQDAKELIPLANSIIAQLFVDSAPLPPAPQEAALDSQILAGGTILETRKLAARLEAAAESPIWLRIFCLLLSKADPSLLNSSEFEQIRRRVDELARFHPDSGVHSASHYLLKNWDCELPKNTPPENAQWNYIPPFDITLTFLEPTTPLKHGAKRFEICTIELTEELLDILDTSEPDPDELPRWPRTPEHAWHGMVLCNELSRLLDLTPCYETFSEKQELIRPKKDYLTLDGFRYPTTEEWIYACSGEARTLYSFGSSDPDIADLFAWTIKTTVEPRPTGLLFPNQRGLFDMHGNLAELCQDFPVYPENEEFAQVLPRLTKGTRTMGGLFNRSLEEMHIEVPPAPHASMIFSYGDQTVRFTRTVPPTDQLEGNSGSE